MNWNDAISRLLAILLIAGLALAPVSRPVMANTSSDISMQTMPEMSNADETANDMPCCPSKAPALVDCDKCVFMSSCTSLAFLGMWGAGIHLFFNAYDDIASPQNDAWPEGLHHPPPEHPPRNLV